MPGVADVERRTRASQEQRDRQNDRDTLLRLIAEGRLHEADAQQLEQIKLALELSDILGKNGASKELDVDAIAASLKDAITDAVASMPTRVSAGVDPTRPEMMHTNLTSISHKKSDLSISHGDTLTTEKEGDEDAVAKLKRLKEIKQGPSDNG
jgi:hypothetical protein